MTQSSAAFNMPMPKGFHMTFANGNTISVQWKEDNYCDDGQTTAEIAIWNDDGVWINMTEDNTVIGWQTPEQVVEWMQKASSGKFA